MKNNIQTFFTNRLSLIQSFSFTTFIKSILIFIWTFFIDVRFFFICVYLLVVANALVTILAYKKEGLSLKLSIKKTEFRNKSFIYLIILLIVFFIDKVLMKLVNFTIYYSFLFVTLIIFIYEGSIIVINLQKLFPNNAILKKVTRYFNIADQTIDGVVKNTSDKIIKMSNDKINEISSNDEK